MGELRGSGARRGAPPRGPTWTPTSATSSALASSRPRRKRSWPCAWPAATARRATGWCARQPAAGGQHRPRLHRQGGGPGGPHRGGQPRPAARRRNLRSVVEHPLQHLRLLLDQERHPASPGLPGEDHSRARLRGRAAGEVRAVKARLQDERAAPSTGEVARALGLSKRKLATVPKAIRTGPGVARPKRATAASLDDSLPDRRAETPLAQMIDREERQRLPEVPAPDRPARGYRLADALRPGRREATYVHGNRPAAA